MRPVKKNNIKKLVESGINKIVVSLYDGPEQVEKYKKLFSQQQLIKINMY